MEKDIVIIGAGITGLSAALSLIKQGFSVAMLEKSDRVGGQIRTFNEEGFVFESGSNTGSVMSEDVPHLYAELYPDCEIEFAHKEAQKRLIWKNGRFHTLPSGLIGGITTPLFTFGDKLRILGEPFRAKGTNPDESVAQLTVRRLGKSFLDYAVDPFLSGIYAGDAHTLITRHALPKLYLLEQNYGSFIKGSIRKKQEARKSGVKPIKKDVFSTKGGMENLPKTMAKKVNYENIFLSCDNVSIVPNRENGIWQISATQYGKPLHFSAKHVVTTVGSYALPSVLPFVDESDMGKISNLRYAPIIQTAVGVKDKGDLDFKAFGGLVSSKDKEDFLGVLYPSSFFENRSPETGMLFSFFMGGIRNQHFMEMNDNEITEKIIRAFHTMLKFPADKTPDLIRIFRHKYAIPQYELSSEGRFETVAKLEKQYPGLHIAGNLRDGIALAQRIMQGRKIAKEIELNYKQ